MGRRGSAVEPVKPRAVVAAATNVALDGTGWRNFKFGDQGWQAEAWRHFDICGELRFVANVIAQSVGQFRLTVCEVDEHGRRGDETDDEQVQEIGQDVFNGASSRSEAQTQIAGQMFVAGDSYIVTENATKPKDDRWYVVSNSQVKRAGGGAKVQVVRSEMFGGGKYELNAGVDLLTRCWKPHPRSYDSADSSVRAALPILRELERLSMMIAAQTDSRLAGAGMMFLPEEMDFPETEKDPGGVEGLMRVIRRAMEASLKDQSDAASLVPIMVQVAGEYIDKIKWQTFQTPFQKETSPLRSETIRRLALALDAPPEVLLGQGSTNHWAAWQIEEGTVKTQLAPIANRIADALTLSYLRPRLKAIGKDPDQYMIWLDPSPLTVRPDRQSDAERMYDKGELSGDALRIAGNWSDGDKPNKAERERLLAEVLVKAQPGLLASEDFQKALGVSWDVSAVFGQQPAQPQIEAGPPPTDTGVVPDQNALPEAPASTETPAQEAALLAGGHQIVQRALELAGKRLLVRGRRGSAEFTSLPSDQLHTLVQLDGPAAERLLDGAFTTAPDLAIRVGMDPAPVTAMLATYTRTLLLRREPHNFEQFAAYVEQALKLVGHKQCSSRCRNPLSPGQCPSARQLAGVGS